MSKQNVVVVVDGRIKADKVDELMAALGRNVQGAKAGEPGCLQFDVLHTEGDATKILVYEVYKDAAALEAHQQTAHFKQFIAEGVPLFASITLSFFQRVAP
ncbi:MAG TPA: putative quinol monooxygenase [Burkholderiaceae bacterium]|nr:putative quinol monooxygenase [Burkholderiaceae bacterium]